jgi:phage recombination protein Bet
MTGAEVEIVQRGGAMAFPRDLDSEQIALIKRTIASGASDAELDLFIRQCNRTQLDPFAKQIFCVPRYDNRVKRMVYQTSPSIDGLRLVAERTKEYAGRTSVYWCGSDGNWVDVWLDESAPPVAAKVGVYKRGNVEVEWGVAHYREFVQTTKEGNVTQMWREKPAHMLGKCAEAIALRATFPHELSGLYIREEIRDDVPEKGDPNRVAPEPPPPTRRILPPPGRRAPATPQLAPAHDGADDEPIEAEVVHEPDVTALTRDQTNRIVALFDENNLALASVRHGYIVNVIGHGYANLRDITEAEGERIIASLEKDLAPPAEPDDFGGATSEEYEATIAGTEPDTTIADEAPEDLSLFGTEPFE